MEGQVEALKKERGNFGRLVSLPLDAERSQFEVNDRLIKGYAIVWGSKNDYNEIVTKGATLNSLQARGVEGSGKNQIVILNQHRQTEVIAKPTVLKEDDYGLYFEAEIIEGTRAADEALAQIRQGVLRQLSYGFNYVWDKVEWDDAAEAYILREIKLFEISVVTFSSDENAQLRSFKQYQQSEMLKEFTPGQIENLRGLLSTFENSESRDEHSEDKEEQKKNNNKVKIF